MNKQTNALNWFEIPVNDFERARHFYQVVFGIHMDVDNMMGMKMAFFPMEMGTGHVSGAIVQSDFHKPSMEGSLIYLNANPDMNEIVKRIETEGGEILMPKTHISDEIGYMAFFRDSEGNRVALHSQN